MKSKIGKLFVLNVEILFKKRTLVPINQQQSFCLVRKKDVKVVLRVATRVSIFIFFIKVIFQTLSNEFVKLKKTIAFDNTKLCRPCGRISHKDIYQKHNKPDKQLKSTGEKTKTEMGRNHKDHH